MAEPSLCLRGAPAGLPRAGVHDDSSVADDRPSVMHAVQIRALIGPREVPDLRAAVGWDRRDDRPSRWGRTTVVAIRRGRMRHGRLEHRR